MSDGQLQPASPDERRVSREHRPALLRWIAQARSLGAVLDLMRQPLVLVLPAEPLQVWHANSAAWRQLTTDSLRIVDGCLSSGPASGVELGQAVMQAVERGPGQARQLQLRAPGLAPLAVQVQALAFGASEDLPVRQLVLVEAAATELPEATADGLCRDFRLTRKEAECALGLYAMGSVEAFARGAGKSIHTVRTQLKAVMGKTGTHTQAGLMSLLGRRLSG